MNEFHEHTKGGSWKEQTKYLDFLSIRNRAHLPTILSLYSSFGFAHVERGVIHPKVKRKVSDYSPGCHNSLLDRV